MNNKIVHTRNGTGYMLRHADSYTMDFIKEIKKVREPHILEIGTALGNISQHIIPFAKEIWMNDLSDEHLDHIAENYVSEADKNKCKFIPGVFPHVINLPENYFDAIIASRIFHFFDGPTLQKAMDDVYRALKKGGKFFWICDSIHIKIARDIWPTYKERVRKGDKWPCLFSFKESNMIDKFTGDNIEMVEAFKLPEVHLMDLSTMVRETERAFFKIEKATYIDRSKENLYPIEELHDGRESTLIIGVK